MCNNAKKILIFLLLFFFSFKNIFFTTLSQQTNVGVGPVAFNTTGFLGARSIAAYLGADSSASNIGEDAVSKIYIYKEDSSDPDSLKLAQLASKEAWVNFNRYETVDGEEVLASPTADEKAINPVYNKGISHLSLMGSSPVVVLSTDNQAPILTGNDQKVCYINSSDSVATTTIKLKDANDNDTNGIAGLEASSTEIFAAVKPEGGDFGEQYSGFSMLVTESGRLIPINAVAGSNPGNKPVELDLAADQLVAFDTAALSDNIVDMHWPGGRLFIALRLHRADVDSDGGAVAILVGRLDESDDDNPYKLILEPVVELDNKYFAANDNNYGVGFYRTNNTDVWASIYNVRTLYTSTKKNYLIVNGGVSTSHVKNQFFALPITGNGKIANKNDFSQEVQSLDQMTTVTELQAKVGNGNLPIGSTDDVKDMFVLGDGVYVCVAGQTGTSYAPEKQGIFHSAAILDSDGNIERWTPWQRVMGSTDKVIGGIIDQFFGNFMYLTLDSTTNETDTIKFTQWGKGSNDGLLGGTTSSESVGLGSLLEVEFTQENYGENQIYNFDYTTPTFTQSYIQSLDNRLALAVATGYKKIGLIEIGHGSDDGIEPNKGDFSSYVLRSTNGSAATGVAGQKVMFISGGNLNDLGGICSTDISRCADGEDEKKGWLFVGGYDGVAVLSDADGNGWETDDGVGVGQQGLQKGFVGITSSMSFKQLSGLSNIRQIVCDDTNLYVLTLYKLYKITLSAGNFDGTVPTKTLLKTAASDEVFIDFMVSSKVGLLASSKGLFRVGNGKNIKSDTTLDWTEVKIIYSGTEYSLGPVVHLDMLSAIKKDLSQGGNLYVLAADYSLNLSDVYRLNVQNTSATAIDADTVKFITEAGDFVSYFSLGEYRSHIHSDGSVFFNQLSKHFGQTSYLRMSQNKFNLTNYGSTRGVNIELSLGGALRVGIISRNFASGSWMVPSNLGLRVNE